MNKYRGTVRFLGDNYTFWTMAESKQSACRNFNYKLAKETDFTVNFVSNLLNLGDWAIDQMGVGDGKDNRFDDRRTRLQSSLDEIIRLAQEARRLCISQ